MKGEGCRVKGSWALASFSIIQYCGKNHYLCAMTYLNLQAIGELAEALRADPGLLNDPKLSVLKKVLEDNYGLSNIPALEKKDVKSKDTTVADAGVFEADDNDELMSMDIQPFPPIPVGSNDYNGAAVAKDDALTARQRGNYQKAIDCWTKAMTLGPVTASTLANRADCLLKIKKPCAAINDCTEALRINPDSAKALRCRGMAYRYIGRWSDAQLDLVAAQTIDFDPSIADRE